MYNFTKLVGHIWRRVVRPNVGSAVFKFSAIFGSGSKFMTCDPSRPGGLWPPTRRCRWTFWSANLL